jgi:hypothetical protein
MRKLQIRFATLAALLCLALVSASPIAAQGNGNPGGNGNNGNNENNGNGNALGRDKKDPPALSATPELSSLALFGASGAGMAAYALMRMRAARRHDTNSQK